MEPLSTALLAALSSAAGALAGGVADAAGGDGWNAIKAKLRGWMHLDERRQQAAFDRAVQEAVKAFRRDHRSPPDAEVVLHLCSNDTPEGRRFLQAAAEELFFSARPDIGRLLDLYRQDLRFTSALQNNPLPEWEAIRPALTLFLQEALPQAMQKQPLLRPLLLDNAPLQIIDELRAQRAIALEQTALLQRIVSMLHDMLVQPRIQATITATNGGSISNAPIHVLFGEYHSLPPSNSHDLQHLFTRYCDYLRGKYELLDFRGILQVQNVLKLPLEAIYVALHASETGSRQDEREQIDGGTGKRGLATSLNDVMMRGTGRLPVHRLIQTTPRLVILGDPGSGKSTLVKYIMLSLLRDQGQERLGLTNGWLPILFPVADFAKACERNPSLAPLEHLRAFYQAESQPDFGQLFERALLSGHALLLFDGLDEVRDSADRMDIVHRLEAFVRTWDLPGNRFLATSRIAGYAEAPLNPTMFVQAEVQAFDEHDIRLFAGKWSAAYERAGWEEGTSEIELVRKSAEHERALSHALSANDQAAELAHNPLLLTMLALIRMQGVTLPGRRVELYELCIKTLAETWSRARSLSGRPIDVYLRHKRQRLDEGFVVRLLGPTALWIHAENPGGLVNQQELERQLAKIFREEYNDSPGDARDLARDFLELVEEQTGLLQARGKNLYGFLHLTLEEYLAACALRDQNSDTPNVLQQYTNEAGWREVVRLCVASLPGLRSTQQALNVVLSTPTDAETRNIPAVRAGECLLDLGPTGTTYQARRSVIDALLAALADEDTPIATRVEAGHVLGRLGDPRLLDAATGKAAGFEEYEAVEPYWCEIAAGRFWFGDDQIDRPRAEVLRNRDEPIQPPRFDPARLTQQALSHNIMIARFPVTNAEFARFLDANGPEGYDPALQWWTEQGRLYLSPEGQRWGLDEAYKNKPITQPRLWNNARYNSPSQPVVGISWYEAAAYCQWLTAEGHAHGWLAMDHVIRLPTSLEWERAARHTDTRPFPWGDDLPTANHANVADAGIGAPSPVGCFPKGRAVCGADDLIGNVLEGTATPNGADTEPVPQKDFTPESGVLLSFTYYRDTLDQMCCGARVRSSPFNWVGDHGFRLVLSPSRSV